MKIFKVLATFLLVGSVLAFSSEVKVGENIKGKEAVAKIKNTSKDLKPTLKVSKAKELKSAIGGQYPFSTFEIDTTKESLLALKDASGNPIVYIAYTNNEIVNTGDKIAIIDALQTEAKNFYIQEWNSQTQKLEGRNINAYEYYNGGHNFNAAYTQWGRPHSNSFGMWVKFTNYPKEPVTIFSRDENIESVNGYRTDYFHFRLLSSGLLSISSKITDYSVDVITTKKPILLNKWVYIQATQEMLNYQIGWKAQDGSDEELVSDTFVKDTLEMKDEDQNLPNPKYSIQRNRLFDLDSIRLYCQNNPNNVALQEAFYNPEVKMFELMNNYNAKEKLLSFAYYRHVDKENRPIFYSIEVLAVEAYNLLATGKSDIVSYEDFDIYYDENTFNIIVIDFRNHRRGAW